MKYDINKFLEFYKKRAIYRYLINLSFDNIENYFKENFEDSEEETLEEENNNINNLENKKNK